MNAHTASYAVCSGGLQCMPGSPRSDSGPPPLGAASAARQPAGAPGPPGALAPAASWACGAPPVAAAAGAAPPGAPPGGPGPGGSTGACCAAFGCGACMATAGSGPAAAPASSNAPGTRTAPDAAMAAAAVSAARAVTAASPGAPSAARSCAPGARVSAARQWQRGRRAQAGRAPQSTAPRWPRPPPGRRARPPRAPAAPGPPTRGTAARPCRCRAPATRFWVRPAHSAGGVPESRAARTCAASHSPVEASSRTKPACALRTLTVPRTGAGAARRTEPARSAIAQGADVGREGRQRARPGITCCIRRPRVARRHARRRAAHGRGRRHAPRLARRAARALALGPCAARRVSAPLSQSAPPQTIQATTPHRAARRRRQSGAAWRPAAARWRRPARAVLPARGRARGRARARRARRGRPAAAPLARGPPPAPRPPPRPPGPHCSSAQPLTAGLRGCVRAAAFSTTPSAHLAHMKWALCGCLAIKSTLSHSPQQRA